VFMWRTLLRVHVEVFASYSCGGLCFVFMWRSLLRVHVEAELFLKPVKEYTHVMFDGPV